MAGPLNLGVTSAEITKRSYERRPYPGTEFEEIRRKEISIPPLKWMQSIGRPGRSRPERVLVAGCGSGAEAFVLRQRLPQAELVAVDFSPRSIAFARRLQREGHFGKPITFQVADLTDPGLAAKTGGDFDLITCHGVLSYLPKPGRVLKHFAACLRPGGALYLGVNGEAHPATRMRPWLADFGLEVTDLHDERRLRELLRLWDSINDDGFAGFAQMSASYLASDICGPQFNNWPLAGWISEFQRSGWEVGGTLLLPLTLRLTLDGDRHRPLYSDGVGRLAARLDQARPASFHQLILHRNGAPKAKVARPGESDPELRWTGLYSFRLTKPGKGRGALAVFNSATFKLQFASLLTRHQAKALSELEAAGAAPNGWRQRWSRTEAADRILWLWEGMGVVVSSATGNHPRSPATPKSRNSG